MSFIVYFFVLLVAAGSVIFGLDWTQAPLNPPPYATAQTAAVAPAPRAAVPARPAAKPNDRPPAVSREALAKAGTATPFHDEATQAQASATEPASDTTTASVPAAAHCNVAACSSAYRSFRASDCTYQPFGGERRLCTKSGVTGKIAAATHAPRSVRRSEPRDERRLTDRRDYQGDRRGGWGLDYFFGGNAYDDER